MNSGDAAWPLGGLAVEEFLRDYWQRKPCLIRQAFADFTPELDENDIAGLACEELVEARLVQGNFESANWTLQHGPFEDGQLAALPERDWCLLVQDVEKHYPPLQDLLARFAFLPSWRLDDLMVSVSAAGGSVGPHVDQYDVFLLQASGRRRWQVAHRFDPELLPNSELRVLQQFNPEQEWELQAGDMLYLPPGIAHYGLALDLGMTWSIGLRAPSQADLLPALGDWLAEHHGEGRRFTDPPLSTAPQAGEIPAAALEQFGRLLAVPGSSADALYPDLPGFLASFISRYRLAHQPAPPEDSLDRGGVLDALARSARLQRNPWTRLNWIADAGDPGHARLFAAGEEFACSRQLAACLCGPELADLAMDQLGIADQEAVTRLLNSGHLFLQSTAVEDA